MNLKEQHKEMKREVEILEQKRRVDRSSVSWQKNKRYEETKIASKG